MRWLLIALMLAVCPLAMAQTCPAATSRPTASTQAVSTTQAKATTEVATTEEVMMPPDVPTGQPVAVPFRLTDTNHLLIRVKINGQGPYNFIVDTGAPAMFLRVPVATKLGLKPNSRGMATMKTLEIEGGLTLHNAQCFVQTPYQIEGMNAIGAPGVDLDGLLGYAILARFRMQIDLSKSRMQWTLLDYIPPRLRISRTADRGSDANETNLESTGMLLKVLGPLIKPATHPSQHHGVIGIELTEKDHAVSVDRVEDGSAAEKAGIKVGDSILSVNNKAVHTVTEAQDAASTIIAGKAINLLLKHSGSELKLSLITGEGL